MTSRRAKGTLGLLALAVGTTACWRGDLYPLSAKPDANLGADVTGADSATGPGFTLYVAPDGDDANPGTLAAPLRTVARARDLVRTRNSGMTADITVYLRGGTYAQTSTLTFGNADSGSGGYYVRYLAYPGERPLITGGQPIKGWKLSDATNNLHSASAGPSAFRQLYVNGSKAVRARSPNLLANGAANFNKTTGADKNAHTVSVASSAVANWSNLTKVEMHLMTAWSDNTLRLASLTPSGNNTLVRFQSTEDALLFVRPFPGLGASEWYYFENALEMLDLPGEWYLDETTHVVTYKPRAGEDMATAVAIAPVVETLVSVKGASPSTPVSYLWFQGLTFAHTTYLRPSQFGFLNGQTGQYTLTAEANNNQTVGRPVAGVSVSNAHHIRFERNLFTQMAATGLDFVSGTHDDMIIGNVFTDIGGNGISVGKFTADETTEYHIPYNPSDKNEICTQDTIRNNYINGVTTEFQGGAGIVCGYPAYITIEHNEVAHTNYMGISVGYGWTTAENAMTNNTINGNRIHHVAEILAGGAGISTMSNQGPASQILYNYLHDFGDSPWADHPALGLYLNQGTAGYTVAHNLMVNTPGTEISLSAGANLVTDNWASPSGAENTLATAGIEPAYADIKSLTLPAATF
jgi:hypothetical protein